MLGSGSGLIYDTVPSSYLVENLYFFLILAPRPLTFLSGFDRLNLHHVFSGRKLYLYFTVTCLFPHCPPSILVKNDILHVVGHGKLCVYTCWRIVAGCKTASNTYLSGRVDSGELALVNALTSRNRTQVGRLRVLSSYSQVENAHWQ